MSALQPLATSREAAAFALYRQAARLNTQAAELLAAARSFLVEEAAAPPSAASFAAAAPAAFTPALPAAALPHRAVATGSGTAPKQLLRGNAAAPARRPARSQASPPARRQLDLGAANLELVECGRR